MMIFYKQRLAYLAIPKTGTSAVERALHRRASAILRDPPGVKHTNARGYERRFRAMFENKSLPPIETVAVMREPVAWLGSWYRYRQRPALSGHPNSTEAVSFEQFVEAYLQENQPPYAKVGSQGRFVTDESGDLLINLFQYEDLAPFITFLEQRLGGEVDLQTVNKSPVKALDLSDELSVELHKKHALDFQIHSALSEGPLSIG